MAAKKIAPEGALTIANLATGKGFFAGATIGRETICQLIKTEGSRRLKPAELLEGWIFNAHAEACGYNRRLQRGLPWWLSLLEVEHYDRLLLCATVRSA